MRNLEPLLETSNLVGPHLSKTDHSPFFSHQGETCGHLLATDFLCDLDDQIAFFALMAEKIIAGDSVDYLLVTSDELYVTRDQLKNYPPFDQLKDINWEKLFPDPNAKYGLRAAFGQFCLNEAIKRAEAAHQPELAQALGAIRIVPGPASNYYSFKNNQYSRTVKGKEKPGYKLDSLPGTLLKSASFKEDFLASIQQSKENPQWEADIISFLKKQHNISVTGNADWSFLTPQVLNECTEKTHCNIVLMGGNIVTDNKYKGENDISTNLRSINPESLATLTRRLHEAQKKGARVIYVTSGTTRSDAVKVKPGDVAASYGNALPDSAQLGEALLAHFGKEGRDGSWPHDVITFLMSRLLQWRDDFIRDFKSTYPTADKETLDSLFSHLLYDELTHQSVRLNKEKKQFVSTSSTPSEDNQLTEAIDITNTPSAQALQAIVLKEYLTLTQTILKTSFISTSSSRPEADRQARLKELEAFYKDAAKISMQIALEKAIDQAFTEWLQQNKGLEEKTIADKKDLLFSLFVISNTDEAEQAFKVFQIKAKQSLDELPIPEFKANYEKSKAAFSSPSENKTGGLMEYIADKSNEETASEGLEDLMGPSSCISKNKIPEPTELNPAKRPKFSKGHSWWGKGDQSEQQQPVPGLYAKYLEAQQKQTGEELAPVRRYMIR